MAVDLTNLDKKKFLILGGAILAGFIAVVLTNTYIQDSVDMKASDIAGKAEARVKELSKKVDLLQQETRVNIQKVMAAQQQAMRAASAKRPEETGVSLAKNTPSGKRAITVEIDILNAVGGLIKPGDYVDVIVHLSKPASSQDASWEKPEKLIVTLFQNVKVLAVGRNIRSKSYSATTSGSLPVTLALNPHEATLMTYAQRQGTLQLVLRPLSESESYVLPTASWKTLEEYLRTTQGLELEPPKEVKPVEDHEKKVFIPDVQIFKGGREVTE